MYNRGNLFPTPIGIPNGYPHTMGHNTPPERNKTKIVFLDVKPHSVQMKPYSRNAVSPLIDNLFDPMIRQDIIFNNIKPVLILLRLLGALPLTKPTAGVNKFKFASPAMLYSTVVLCSLVTHVIFLSLHKVQILKTAEGKFEEAVIEYLFTVYLFPLLIIPVMWYETRKISGILNEWFEFEINYKKLSGHVLQVRLYKKALIMALIIPVLSTSSVLITHMTLVQFKLVQVIPYIFLEILTYVLGSYWYLLCETLSVCADILASDFQQSLRHIGPAGSVAEYRALWLRLSKLSRNTGTANCYTFTFVSLYLFLIITLSIYGLLSKISAGFGLKDIGLALTACCSICLLFFICDEAHYASHNVRSNFQKKLLMVELSWMNTDAQTEVNMFLRATELNNSKISLGGFFDVNRILFKSLLATMVTYLVVLLQFQISIPEDPLIMSDTDQDQIFNYTHPSTATTVASTILTTLSQKKNKQ